jgi:hypothetical protein
VEANMTQFAVDGGNHLPEHTCIHQAGRTNRSTQHWSLEVPPLIHAWSAQMALPDHGIRQHRHLRTTCTVRVDHCKICQRNTGVQA